MGTPGVNVSIVLGRQKRYGATMVGSMIWYCNNSHDAISESINNLSMLQYQNGHALGKEQIDYADVEVDGDGGDETDALLSQAV
jgi:hypothetical protein